ncbi:MAG: TlpA family protein disulfide reductase [Gemmatimonadota bacterium]
MSHTRGRIALGLALAVAAGFPRPAAAQGRADIMGIARGEIPPAVVIEDLEGRDVDLGEIIGHGPALIEFWATWCENCAALHPRLQAAHRRWGDRMSFLAVAVAVGQNPRSIRRHLKKEPVRYPTLWDAGGRAVRAFHAPVTSYIVVLDAEGRVTYTGAGRDQDVEAAIRTAFTDS